MDKSYLLASAKQLKKVSLNSAKEYIKNSEKLTSKINVIMLDRADVNNLVGIDNLSMMKDNHSNHVRFIGSILTNFNAEVLVDTVLWVFRAYQSHGFSVNYWAAQLNGWISILKEELSIESYNEIYPLYEWMQINIPTFTKVSKEQDITFNAAH